MSTELWERWLASTTAPLHQIKRGAKIHHEPVHTLTLGGTLDGTPPDRTVITRKWITFTDDRDGRKAVVSMPEDAVTKSCQEDRHHQCNHRLGAVAEGGIVLKLGLPGFCWRCGCACHRNPAQAGFLF